MCARVTVSHDRPQDHFPRVAAGRIRQQGAWVETVRQGDRCWVEGTVVAGTLQLQHEDPRQCLHDAVAYLAIAAARQARQQTVVAIDRLVRVHAADALLKRARAGGQGDLKRPERFALAGADDAAADAPAELCRHATEGLLEGLQQALR